MPGTNFIIGPNAHGKTSLAEAACILLRLQSPRIGKLGAAIQHGRRGFVLDGYYAQRHMQFYYGTERKKLALDSVQQTDAREYLEIARAVWFSNRDIELCRGSGEVRRKFLDFIASQRDIGYRAALRGYERALRSRNLLLKHYPPRWAEIKAFDEPYATHGHTLMAGRRQLIWELLEHARVAHKQISGERETLHLEYLPGADDDLHAALAASRAEDARLRVSTVGPHRDDMQLMLNGTNADTASEGQQRTMVLALKLGAARLIEAQFSAPPVILLDDVFGELDRNRRAALLEALPHGSQRIITTTFLDWLPGSEDAHIIRLGDS